MTNKLKVGVIGLGSMGSTHLDIYSKINDVEVIAIADSIQSRLDGSSKAAGNISGQAEGGVFGLSVKKYLDGMDLINNPDIDIVDICVGTDLHFIFVEAALAKGKHVLVEKPLARTYEEAKKIVQLAQKSSSNIMSAMCLRYWPAWVWLKEAIESEEYGKCLSLNCKRQTSFPGGSFYSSHEQCGGALLDLHVHDTDFINYCFGLPVAVFSQGYKGPSSGIDHVVTNYIFDKKKFSPLVSSEGSWTMQDGYGFDMSYTANFENGTATYLLDEKETLKFFRSGSEPQTIDLKEGMGYEFEIRAFVDEILSGKASNLGLLKQAAETIAIIEAEKISIETCSVISVEA
ncbi:Gfo/Idh/MocA family protein [Candidatus Pseudothioglobus sp. Uisw_086]|uniref:Gfo/Idh/MocA family protein n=1 Tax=Candidatus Pseudothioglobus sp. Uisw_086 TaxID=3230998 RepID=UPI003A84CE99